MSYVWIVVAGVCWGLIGLFTRAVTALGFTEMEMLFVKAVVSTLFLTLVLLVRNRSGFRLKKISDIWYFAGTGIASFTFFSWCYMKAINLTSVGVAAVLLYTAPTLVMLFSAVLFHDKMTKRKVFVLFMTLAGCAMVTGLLEGGATLTRAGFLAGMGAAFGYALYSVFGALALRRGYDSLTISFYTFLLAAIFMVFCVDPVQVVQEISQKGQWLLVVAFAMLTTVVPYLCYTKGLSGLPASKASVTATIEPVVAALLGIIVLHEEITISKVGGILLVVGAVVFMNMGKESVPNETQEAAEEKNM